MIYGSEHVSICYYFLAGNYSHPIKILTYSINLVVKFCILKILIITVTLQDPEEQMKRIATFLSLSVSGELIKKIREECSLQSMRDKKGKFDLDKEGNPIMYRKGKPKKKNTN